MLAQENTLLKETQVFLRSCRVQNGKRENVAKKWSSFGVWLNSKSRKIPVR